MSSHLAELTGPETAGARQVLVVPVGSLEQHGPHLPLDTDTRIATALACELARRRPVVVAPAIAYGASGEHEGFAGTVSVGREGLRRFVVELVRSASETFGRVLFVNGHGGNVETLTDAVAQLLREGRDVRVWTVAVPGGDAHAGRTETSLLCFLHPELVRTDWLQAGATAPLEQLWPALRTRGVAAVSPNGVLGDPRLASAEEGAALFDRLASELEQALEHW